MQAERNIGGFQIILKNSPAMQISPTASATANTSQVNRKEETKYDEWFSWRRH